MESEKKAVRPRRNSRAQVNYLGAVCGIVGMVWTVVKFLRGLLHAPPAVHGLVGLPRLQALLFLGLAAAAAHGILWEIADKTFGWKLGAGGGRLLPEGWSAVTLSATMTIPLVTFPPLYSRFTHSNIVPPGHALAAWLVILTGAVGHLFLYSSKGFKFRGLKRRIYPLGSPPDRLRALLMELAYAGIHFTSIVLTYRIAVGLRSGYTISSVVYPVMISGGAWLSGVCVFIFLKGRASVADKKIIEVRGIIHALMLMVALQGGMLMA